LHSLILLKFGVLVHSRSVKGRVWLESIYSQIQDGGRHLNGNG